MATVNSVSATFFASIKSVGTAVTMAGVGFYLHHRNFITKDGKRALALMSQQVTFPLYFFTKIIYCNQDWSDKPCPDVTSTLHDTWMLLLWPCFMVGSGLAVGKWVANLTQTPKSMVPSVLAAVAFANNTALPITLLAVVHANFPSTSDLGRIDPTLFLSVYLVVYPILQWSLGGWILAPGDDDDIRIGIGIGDNNADGIFKTNDYSSAGAAAASSAASSIRDSFRRILNGQHPIKGGGGGFRNVVNNKEIARARKNRTHGLTSTDEGCYMTELDLEKLGRELGYYSPSQEDGEALLLEMENDMYMYEQQEKMEDSVGTGEGCPLLEASTEYYDALRKNSADVANQFASVIVSDLPLVDVNGDSNANGMRSSMSLSSKNSNKKHGKKTLRAMSSSFAARSQRTTVTQYETDSLWETVKNILDRTLFQPPVIGALLGILCAITPARGYFVDLVNRHSGAPLQWLFDGLYKVGLIAVPDNMLILGCNISASYNSYVNANQVARKSFKGKASKELALPRKTMIGIVVGKMIVLPFIGITTTYLLKNYVFNIPDEIAGAFYLVLMIVFLTPTANNVMIMIELADCDPAIMEGVANVIAMQYIVAPVILSFTMSVAIGVASEWS